MGCPSQKCNTFLVRCKKTTEARVLINERKTVIVLSFLTNSLIDLQARSIECNILQRVLIGVYGLANGGPGSRPAAMSTGCRTVE
jgi:hypothetical protein